MGSVVAAPRPSGTGLVAAVHGHSCSMACKIFPDQELNLCPPALAGRFFTTEPPGQPGFILFGFEIIFATFFCLFACFSHKWVHRSPHDVMWKWNSPMCYFLTIPRHLKEQ